MNAQARTHTHTHTHTHIHKDIPTWTRPAHQPALVACLPACLLACINLHAPQWARNKLPHTEKQARIHRHGRMQACMHAHMDAHKHTHAGTCKHKHTQAHASTHIQAHASTHAPMHTHKQTWSCKKEHTEHCLHQYKTNLLAHACVHFPACLQTMIDHVDGSLAQADTGGNHHAKAPKGP